MIRGSTPTFTLSLPTDPSVFVSAEATFVQDGRCLLVKTTGEMAGNAADRTLSFALSESETLLFAAGSVAELQLRLVTEDGQILLSYPKRLAVGRRLPEDAE